MRKCCVEGCNCETANNARFCSKHMTGIEFKCSSCGKTITIKPRNYEPKKEYFCRSCSSRNRIIKYNKSEEAKKVRSKNMHNYNASEIGIKNREKGLETMHKNYTGSTKHISQITNLGLKFGPMKNKKTANND